jgi:hypothetical protein
LQDEQAHIPGALRFPGLQQLCHRRCCSLSLSLSLFAFDFPAT